MSEIAYGSYTQFSGGMNAAFDPAGIEADQYALGVNVTNRGGVVRTRPSFKRVIQNFSHYEEREFFRRGKFQGCSLYNTAGRTYTAVAVDGKIYVVDLHTGDTVNLTSAENRPSLNPEAEQCWFLQVETYLIIQDGTSNPVILDGLSARVADPEKNEVPPGTVMAYGHGRIFVSTGTGAVMAGDANDPTNSEKVLLFTETDDIDLGGYLDPASDVGRVRAMYFLDNVDTSTGTGPLIVAGDSGAVSFRVDVPRAEWRNVVFRKFLIGGQAPVSAWAVADMNADKVFWTKGGLRSLAVLLAEVTNARRFVNLSKEVAPLYQYDPPELWHRCSAAVANGRLLFTINPTVFKTTRFGQDDAIDDLGYRSIVSLDFDHLRGKAMQGQYVSTVSFDGVWTGPLIMQLVGQDDHAWFAGRDMTDDGAFNALYEITDQQSGYDDGTPIRCRLVSRGLVTELEPDYNPAPFIRKQYVSTAVWFRDTEQPTPVDLALSIDDSPLFTRLATVVLDAPIVRWNEGTLEIPEAGDHHSFPGYRFPNPGFLCDPVTGGSLLTGYTFQFCLDWQGNTAFSRTLLTATRDPKTSEDPCPQRPRELVRPDGRKVETFNPFHRIRDFYAGDVTWYGRRRDDLSTRPALAPEPVARGDVILALGPAGRLHVMTDEYLYTRETDAMPLSPYASDMGTAVTNITSATLDNSGNLVLGVPLVGVTGGIYVYEGTDHTSVTRLAKRSETGNYWGWSVTRTPDGENLACLMYQGLFTNPFAEGVGNYAVIFDGFDVDMVSSYFNIPVASELTPPVADFYPYSMAYDGNLLAMMSADTGEIRWYDPATGVLEKVMAVEIPAGQTLRGFIIRGDLMFISVYGGLVPINRRVYVYYRDSAGDWVILDLRATTVSSPGCIESVPKGLLGL